MILVVPGKRELSQLELAECLKSLGELDPSEDDAQETAVRSLLHVVKDLEKKLPREVLLRKKHAADTKKKEEKARMKEEQKRGSSTISMSTPTPTHVSHQRSKSVAAPMITPVVTGKAPMIVAAAPAPSSIIKKKKESTLHGSGVMTASASSSSSSSDYDEADDDDDGSVLAVDDARATLDEEEADAEQQRAAYDDDDGAEVHIHSENSVPVDEEDADDVD